jgi:hypothetical protein
MRIPTSLGIPATALTRRAVLVLPALRPLRPSRASMASTARRTGGQAGVARGLVMEPSDGSPARARAQAAERVGVELSSCTLHGCRSACGL